MLFSFVEECVGWENKAQGRTRGNEGTLFCVPLGMKITQNTLDYGSINTRFGSVGRITSYAWSCPVETFARLVHFAKSALSYIYSTILLKFYVIGT